MDATELQTIDDAIELATVALPALAKLYRKLTANKQGATPVEELIADTDTTLDNVIAESQQ